MLAIVTYIHIPLFTPIFHPHRLFISHKPRSTLLRHLQRRCHPACGSEPRRPCATTSTTPHPALALGPNAVLLYVHLVHFVKYLNQPEYYDLYLLYVMIILWYTTLHSNWFLPGKAGMARWADPGIFQCATPRRPMRHGWTKGVIVLVGY